MQKSLMAVIASLVVLAVVLVGFGAARERRAESAAGPMAVTHAAPQNVKAQTPDSAAGNASDDTPADSGDDSANVIRFVRDPSPAPPFLLNDLDGNVISTAAYHGKVVLINFWATWCPPCREEIPEMIGLAKKFSGNLQIIGVSMDDDPASEVRAFARGQNMNYPIVMGSDKLSEEYGGVDALPTTFVLDTNGRVVQKHMGVYPEEVYDREIRALLGLHVDEPVETFADTGQIFLRNVAHATSLPGVDFSGLTPGLKKLALKRLNTELCTCGCKRTVAQCRMTDPDCATSKALAAKIIREIKAQANPLAPNSTSAQNE
ncbi:MAG: TlpA disulfide reductase family protein [Candidatus Acidiferrales bacterium]